MQRTHRTKPATTQETSEFLTCMAEKVSDYAIFILDANGIIRTWNKAAENMKGYTAQEAIGSFLGLLYTDEERKNGHAQHNLKAAAENGTYQEETWRRKKDGSLFWAMIELIAIKKPNGELRGFCKITRDITVRKELQSRLAAEKERAQVTLGAIGDAVIAINANGDIDYLNAKAEELTGWLHADAAGHSFSDVFHAIDESTGQPQEHQLVSWLKQGRAVQKYAPAVLISRDGTRYAIEDTAAPICLPDGQIAGGVIVFRDVTQSRQFLNAVTHQARHDALTGLVNRSEFESRLQRSLERASQAHTTGAVLYMDLDQFKIVNDVCGHHAGDDLLKQIAQLYRAEIRERDTLARLGGDEFALIADHCTVEEAYSIANKILQSTRNFQFVCKERVFKVGVSIGLATFDETIRDNHEILQMADHACYVAKEKGRNQIYCQQPGERVSAQHNSGIDWISRLNEAMSESQLQLHCQRISDATGAGGLRYEVLLRLVDSDGGVILPERFLPAAERYALMPTIDRWVVRHVLQWLEEHRQHAEELDLCAINLSPKTVIDGSFLADLADIFKQHGVAPAKICFEVAEAAVTADIRKSIALIDGLRAMGCKVSLDDFGKGVGSFAQLKQLSADFIKFDPAFVSMVTHSVFDKELVKALSDIAHLMGKKTIAQCVEDQATAHVLSTIGIDYVQGYWVGRPQELAKSFH